LVQALLAYDNARRHQCFIAIISLLTAELASQLFAVQTENGSQGATGICVKGEPTSGDGNAYPMELILVCKPH